MERLASVSKSSPELNRVGHSDRPIHDWYRFILSYPPHLVRDYLKRFEVVPDQRVLDPFCGTGTTLIECAKLGVGGVGVEANPTATQSPTRSNNNSFCGQAHCQRSGIASVRRRLN